MAKVAVGGFFVILLLLAAAIAAPHDGAKLGEAIQGLDQQIDLSRHAAESHQNQTWNAGTIQSYMASGGCIPQEYSCVATDLKVRYCEIKPGLAIGLVIGKTVEQVVTGFAARTSYWQNQNNRCNQ